MTESGVCSKEGSLGRNPVGKVSKVQLEQKVKDEVSRQPSYRKLYGPWKSFVIHSQSSRTQLK